MAPPTRERSRRDGDAGHRAPEVRRTVNVDETDVGPERERAGDPQPDSAADVDHQINLGLRACATGRESGGQGDDLLG